MLLELVDLDEKGFRLIDFPSELIRLMLDHVTQAIHDNIESTRGHLTDCLQSVSDETFDRIFDKSKRIFPDKISKVLMEWVQKEVVAILGGKSAKTNAPWSHRLDTVASPEYCGKYDIYWRCVRPFKKDVGATHADWQFWDIARDVYGENFCTVDYDERWKIWIPLYGCDKLNGLQVVPKSHLESVPFLKRTTEDGVIKPDIEACWLQEKEDDFVCPFDSFENQAIIFHDKLIHRGPMNVSDSVRISAEITVLLKR